MNCKISLENEVEEIKIRKLTKKLPQKSFEKSRTTGASPRKYTSLYIPFTCILRICKSGEILLFFSWRLDWSWKFPRIHCMLLWKNQSTASPFFIFRVVFLHLFEDVVLCKPRSELMNWSSIFSDPRIALLFRSCLDVGE